MTPIERRHVERELEECVRIEAAAQAHLDGYERAVRWADAFDDGLAYARAVDLAGCMETVVADTRRERGLLEERLADDDRRADEGAYYRASAGSLRSRCA